jgi:glycosyltransferase involved in cell wall biosynthesis
MVRDTADVALLIPCFNAEEFLGSLIETSRIQTVPFRQVICYDDCSTDSTRKVAKALGADLIEGERNRGPAHARNRLLDAAKTRWVHFHDADDGLAPEFNERMLGRLADDQSEAAVCAVRRTFLDRSGDDEILRFHGAIGGDLVRYAIENFIHLNAFIFSRAKLKAVGGFNEEMRFAEDRDLFVRLAHAGLKLSYVDEPLVTWVQHPSSMVGKATRDILRHHEAVFLERCQLLLKEDYRDFIGQLAYYRAWRHYFESPDEPKIRDFIRENIRIANRCGIRHGPHAGSLERRISWLFGTQTMFYLKKRWSDLARKKAKFRSVK